MLLSFAQYERGLAGERIRDTSEGGATGPKPPRTAASRKRGLWMGGLAPLGYDIVERKLVVNPAEADLVRLIFQRFLEVGSATKLVGELAAAGHRTKSWTTQGGKAISGSKIDKGFLYKLLNNRIYLGEAVHKGAVYPGEHAAIIDPRTWEQVQAILAENARTHIYALGQSHPGRHPGPAEGVAPLRLLGHRPDPKPHPAPRPALSLLPLHHRHQAGARRLPGALPGCRRG